MKFNQHFNLTGKHAIFSPSQSYWLKYDDGKLLSYFKNKQASDMGTRLHAWAKTTIDLGIKQPKSKKTLYLYVNDAIGFKMNTEVVLYYSDIFFGTTDAISFRNNFLRIHDLKTGVTPASMDQLMVYAALFCLEYRINPSKIGCELRIYQNNDYTYVNPEPEEIQSIMDIIVHMNNVIETQYNSQEE